MMSFAVLSGYCSAKIYKVGDSEGWTAKDGVYYAWAETDYKEFHVGDSLVFEYDPSINDVTQKLEVLVIHDPSSPVPPPTPSKILPIRKTYKVGDSEGWKVYDSDFYNKWSEEKQFHVGDSLLFEYANEVNDVYEINGDLEFMTCDPTSPVAVHKTGHDLVRFTEPGVHYFITSHSGSCEVGLKLRVVVGPVPKAVTYPNNPNFPKKVDLSATERPNNWLKTFKPQLHH
ncbi:PREDICTED: early nodulin-20-like [Brassica oleracea var. oleracea]|nr:PREDICTED: early nodulin-20-like [Brassica oleracea var. oleracea]